MKVVVSLLNFRPGKIGGTETYLRSSSPACRTSPRNSRSFC